MFAVVGLLVSNFSYSGGWVLVSHVVLICTYLTLMSLGPCSHICCPLDFLFFEVSKSWPFFSVLPVLLIYRNFKNILDISSLSVSCVLYPPGLYLA